MHGRNLHKLRFFERVHKNLRTKLKMKEPNYKFHNLGVAYHDDS